jgi:GTPase SAR1 family protein
VEANQEFLMKVLVVGDTGTGKTSFIKRYVHNTFSESYKVAKSDHVIPCAVLCAASCATSLSHFTHVRGVHHHTLWLLFNSPPFSSGNHWSRFCAQVVAV